MELNHKESRDGITWLLCAGGIAILFSISLYCADEHVMGKATERDHKHAAEMAELRTAQVSVPGRVTDERQLLPLTLEHEDSAASDKH
jgi:hypothetical protein